MNHNFIQLRRLVVSLPLKIIIFNYKKIKSQAKLVIILLGGKLSKASLTENQ